jgi:hypothetical protein
LVCVFFFNWCVFDLTKYKVCKEKTTRIEGFEKGGFGGKK